MIYYIRIAIFILAYVALLTLFGDPAEAADNKAAWSAHAERMELKYDLPPGMLRAICEQESNWRNVVGAHGEIGVCQLKPDTVRMICPACGMAAMGAQGDGVLRVQGFLKAAGHYSGHLDGVFGPRTKAAVLEYQQQTALLADGVVGPGTWRAMFAEPYPGAPIADALWNPELNIEWAARYLTWLRDNVSADPIIMVGAYNGGHANPVVRYMRSVNRRLEVM